MKKMSYTGALDVVLSGGAMTDEVKERLTALKASLEKRAATKSSKPTKAQSAAIALAERIVGLMEVGKSYEWKEIAALIPDVENVSAQRVTALMKRAVDSGRVAKEEVKGKMTYTLIDADAVDEGEEEVEEG